MKQLVIFILLIGITVITGVANAIDIEVKKKYPGILLTDDYGILKEVDLAAYTWHVNAKPFSKNSMGLNYWLCLSTSSVSISLIDKGYSDKYITEKENLADLHIIARPKNEIPHEYVMPGYAGISDYKKLLNLWKKLMKGEKYVCIGGSFISLDEEMEDGKKEQVYTWIFDKIKTKKGCDSRFYDHCY